MRILLISMFFAVDCVYVIDELRKRKHLRIYAHIDKVLTLGDVYRLMSRFDEDRFVSLISGILNSVCTPSCYGRSRTILIDSMVNNPGSELVQKTIYQIIHDEPGIMGGDIRRSMATTLGIN